MIEPTEEQGGAVERPGQSCPCIDWQKAILDDDDVRRMEPLLADLDPGDWENATAYEGKP